MSIIERIKSALEELKIRDISIYDLGKKSVIADYIVVSTADSSVQLDSGRGRIEELMWKTKLPLKNPSEDWNGGWLIMDYGDIIINIFLEEKRSFYNLDGLLGSHEYESSEIKNVFNR
ncbi:MAG: ribosome silencing factor [Spirochaetes bacterium GWF1_51_8]|nr:MAG: ribosome silencing factor [Spirochaetes bacterium GWF1_51_8]